MWSELLDLLPVVAALALGAASIWAAEHLPRWADELDRRVAERTARRQAQWASQLDLTGILIVEEPMTAQQLAEFRRAWREALERAPGTRLDALNRQAIGTTVYRDSGGALIRDSGYDEPIRLRWERN